MSQQALAAIADRLERSADRMANAGLVQDEQRLRAAASRVRAGMELPAAQQLESELLALHSGQALGRAGETLVAFAAQGGSGGDGHDGDGHDGDGHDGEGDGDGHDGEGNDHDDETKGDAAAGAAGTGGAQSGSDASRGPAAAASSSGPGGEGGTAAGAGPAEGSEPVEGSEPAPGEPGSYENPLPSSAIELPGPINIPGPAGPVAGPPDGPTGPSAPPDSRPVTGGSPPAPPAPRDPREPSDRDPHPSTGPQSPSVAPSAPPTPAAPPAPAPAGISAETGRQVAQQAAVVAKDYNKRNIMYVPRSRWDPTKDAARGGSQSDCSHFVADVLKHAGVGAPYVTTATIRSSPNFIEVQASALQAGDIIVQGGHMGVFMGSYDAAGHPIGTQMGEHYGGHAAAGPWGPGGWFKNSGDLHFYRPKP